MLTPWLLLAAAAGLPGCGESGAPAVWVSGVLLKGGAPFKAPAGQKLTVTLVAIEVRAEGGKSVPSTEPYLAGYEPADGTFEVPGRDGRGIPPGRYRVAITAKMDREAYNAANLGRKGVDREKDYLDGRFDEATSPIIRVIEAATKLSIDMDKPTEGAPAS